MKKRPQRSGDTDRDIAVAVRDTLLIPQNISADLKPILDHLPSLSEDEARIGHVFVRSLQSIERTVSMPFIMTHRSFQAMHRLRFLVNEKGKAAYGAVDARTDQAVRNSAFAKAEDFFASESGVDDLIDWLYMLNEDDETAQSVRELTRQGIVLTWSAIEVFARDLFVVLLNASPRLANNLLSNPTSKKRFALDRIDWQTLSDNSFDLSASLGRVLIAKSDLKGMPAIKDVFCALFPQSEELRIILSDDALWQLSQQRHLIVHRCGIVDAAYIRETGSSLKEGENFWPTPDQIHGALQVAAKAADIILRCVSSNRQ